MNLILDQGNTLVKAAVFDNNELCYKSSLEISALEQELDLIQDRFPNIDHCIMASVGKRSESVESLLSSRYRYFQLDQNTPVPFTNEYATPATLGVDRIALASAAVMQFPKQNALIIDAGSCITYDFVTDAADYLGGAIAPGIRM